MTTRAAIAMLVLLVAPTSEVRADDWLALYPACAQGPDARAPGLTRILYPRAGFAAVVEVGDHLVARVRVPSGLTPPPGIQQDRALRRWSALLLGRGLGLDPTHFGRVRYTLRVADVRPDGAGTVVYRATLPIPAWAAPGTYDLQLSAPGGTATVAGAVRLVAARTRVVLARAPRGASGRDLASAAVDVWNAGTDLDAGAGEAPASLRGAPYGAVLRVGNELWVADGCDDAPVHFEEQVRALARAEARPLRRMQDALDALPEGLAGAYDAASTSPNELHVTARPTSGPIVLTLVAPNDGGSTLVTGARDVFHYPGGDLGDGRVLESIILRVEVSPGSTLSAIHTPRTPRRTVSLALDVPTDAVAGAEAVFRIRPQPPRGATIAWSFGEDLDALGPEVHHTFRGPGDPIVDALVLYPDGSTVRLEARAHIGPHASTGCSFAQVRGPAHAMELLLGLVLWHIRRRRRESLRVRPSLE